MRSAFLLLVMAGATRATTYYVDATGGSNANAGTSAGAAWQTVAFAMAQTFAANDTLAFKRGETFLLTATIEPTVNGMIFEAYGTGALPILNGQSVLNEIIDCNTRQNTITRFLHLKNGGPEGGDTTGGSWTGRIGTNTIEDCTVDTHTTDALVDGAADAHIIVRRCLITGAFDDGITLHVTASALVENCEITACGAGINNSGTAMDLTVNDTYIHDNTSAEISSLSATTATFNRCRFKGAVKLFDASTLPVTFRYCIFDASAGGSAVAPEFNTLAATTAENCVFWGNGKGKMGISNAAFNATNCIFSQWNIAANLFTGGTLNKNFCITHSVTSGTTTSNTNAVSTSSPLFTLPASGDFTLQAGSPAINAGTNLGLLLDLASSPVGNPPEVGVYELVTVRPYRLRFARRP